MISAPYWVSVAIGILGLACVIAGPAGLGIILLTAGLAVAILTETPTGLP